MAKQNIPEQPTQLTAQYSTLLGVDFQSDPTEVARYRSPDMVNMISDLGGSPIKRYGYRVFGGFSDSGYEVEDFAVIAGRTYAVKTRQRGNYVDLFAVEITKDENGQITEGEPLVLGEISGFGDVKKVFTLNGYLYVLTERARLRFDLKNPEKYSYSGASIGMNLMKYPMQSSVSSGTKAMELRPVIPHLTDFDYAGELGYTTQTIPFDGANVTRYATCVGTESVPVVSTLLKPNGKEMISLPNGTDITGATQGVNLLQPFRAIEYCVQTDTADELRFYFPNNELAAVHTIKVEVLDSATLAWKPLTRANYGWNAAGNIQYVATHKPSWAGAYEGELSTDIAIMYGARSFSFSYYSVEGHLVDARPYKKVMVDNEPHLRFRDNDTVEVPMGVPNVRVTYAPINRTVYRALTADEKTCYAGVTPSADSADVSEASFDSSNAYVGIYNETRDGILGTDVFEIYDSRTFSGFGNLAYYSRVNNPLMVDDNFYFSVDSDIASFAKSSSALSVIPSDASNGHIYLAKGEYNDTLGMPTYTITASNASVGSIGAEGGNFGVLNDEPVFLSTTGIYAMSTNYMSEKYAVSRSGKIDRRLAQEPKLRQAVGIVWNNYLWLAVGTHMYILDGRHKEKQRNGDNSYECYYYEDLPEIKKLHIVLDKLYFEDADGTMYTWNDDLQGKYRYMDGITWNSTTEQWENGRPVKARWSSMVDGDNAPQYYKILQKKGTMVTIAPPMQTSCQVTIIKDGNERIYIGRFDGSTFALSNVALDGFTKKKIKKYKRLQFIVENNEAEPFSIISVIKTYIMGNYAKR